MSGNPKPRSPQTRKEWQEAADAAHVLLTIDAARQYGLIEGGPECDQERCVEILRLAKLRRIVPRKDCIEQVLGSITLRTAEALDDEKFHDGKN